MMADEQRQQVSGWSWWLAFAGIRNLVLVCCFPNIAGRFILSLEASPVSRWGSAVRAGLRKQIPPHRREGFLPPWALKPFRTTSGATRKTRYWTWLLACDPLGLSAKLLLVDEQSGGGEERAAERVSTRPCGCWQGCGVELCVWHAGNDLEMTHCLRRREVVEMC